MTHLKTIIALSIALNMASLLCAQDLKRFKLDVFYGFEHVETNNKGTIFFEPRNKKQVAQNVGLNVNYGINDRLFVKMGLRLTILTQTVFSNYFSDCGNTTQEEKEFAKAEIKNKQFAEIALSSAVRYYVQKKKPIFNMYVEGVTDILHSDYESGIVPALGIAYGFEVLVWQKVSVFIQPTYRFRLGKVVNSERLDLNIRQHNVGIAAGFRF